MTQRILRWLPLVPISVGLVLHSLVFNFVSDDAYISFVYARNLAEHGQLVFNLGQHVEGYTNFLWTVLLAVLLKIGIAPEIASRVLGTAFAIGTLIVVVKLVERLRGRATLWDFVAPALLAASSGFACWASGGLETQMFTFFATLGMAWILYGKQGLAGLAFGLAALTRPEGVLIFAVACAHWFVMNLITEKRIKPKRPELLFVGVFLLVFVPYFAWRWWYYGWLFPNTFYVKAGGGASPAYAHEMLKHGLYFVWQWATQSRAIYAAPFAIYGAIRFPRFGSFALALTAVYLAYTIKVGGDFMGLHRFVMPLFVTTAVLAVLGVASLKPLAVSLPLAAALAGVFVFTQVKLSKESLIAQADNGIDRPGYLKLYAEDRELIGKALADHIRPDDFSIVGGVGVQPYYARMRAIDVFGLVSDDIAHNEPPINPRPGHQKWARPERLLKYDPTFIFHCYDLHHDPARYVLCGDAAYFEAHGYEPMTIHIPGLRERGEYYTFLKRKDRVWE